MENCHLLTMNDRRRGKNAAVFGQLSILTTCLLITPTRINNKIRGQTISVLII